MRAPGKHSDLGFQRKESKPVVDIDEVEFDRFGCPPRNLDKADAGTLTAFLGL